MNELQKAYCDGAAMAYRDTAKQIEGMVERCPPELKGLMESFAPIAKACMEKSKTVYDAATLFEMKASDKN